eukprot:4421867-Alexandrium_andersonii.AAC.1
MSLFNVETNDRHKAGLMNQGGGDKTMVLWHIPPESVSQCVSVSVSLSVSVPVLCLPCSLWFAPPPPPALSPAPQRGAPPE